MKEIIASPNRVLHLGYEGEDNVTLIKFPYDDTWLDCGDGEFKVRVLRHGDTQAYNATEVIDDRENMTLTMTVTDIELSVRGRGELQLVYVCSGAIKKSEIYQYNVHRAIDSEVVSPPDGSIIASVEESLEEIKDEIGSLAELTTTDKSSLVSAINEVNQQGGGGSVTVDDELSGTSENPVQNKVVKARFDSVDGTVAGIGGRLATAETVLAGKADKSYVDTELLGKANSADVETALASKANTSDVNSALSLKANTADVNTALASKANSADVQTALAGKASTDVATQSANGLMSSADKTKLDAVGSVVTVSGTTPTITALSGVRYVCGEVSTLDITPCVSGICDIVFTSGSTATVLTITPPTGMTMKWAGGFDPTALEADATYWIRILDGMYGDVTAWGINSGQAEKAWKHAHFQVTSSDDYTKEFVIPNDTTISEILFIGDVIMDSYDGFLIKIGGNSVFYEVPNVNATNHYVSVYAHKVIDIWLGQIGATQWNNINAMFGTILKPGARCDGIGDISIASKWGNKTFIENTAIDFYWR